MVRDVGAGRLPVKMIVRVCWVLITEVKCTSAEIRFIVAAPLILSTSSLYSSRDLSGEYDW